MRLSRFREGIIDSLRRIILNTFDPVCPVCNENWLSSDIPLCNKCIEKLDLIKQPVCPICSLPLPEKPGKIGWTCGICTRQPPPFEKLDSLLTYNSNFSKRILYQIKERNNFALLPVIEKLFRQTMLKYNSSHYQSIDVVIPIPASPSRYFKSLSNHVAEISRSIAKVLNAQYYDNVLFMKKNFLPQKQLDFYARFKNIKGVFYIQNSSKIKNKNVLIVDDVSTTTATLREASSCCLKHGAAKVYAFSLFRA